MGHDWLNGCHAIFFHDVSYVFVAFVIIEDFFEYRAIQVISSSISLNGYGAPLGDPSGRRSSAIKRKDTWKRVQSDDNDILRRNLTSPKNITPSVISLSGVVKPSQFMWMCVLLILYLKYISRIPEPSTVLRTQFIFTRKSWFYPRILEAIFRSILLSWSS